MIMIGRISITSARLRFNYGGASEHGYEARLKTPGYYPGLTGEIDEE
ncbi:hypothetical protein JW926_05370 [Candidatus Sumerlaeota bacterium]|nr:hypothetical protein [Candidatus Sumerlaeota bacterium]